MNDSGLVYRVVDWDGRHETARSLKKSGPRAEVSVSSDLGGGALARLLALPDSATLLGVWYFIQALAANCERRGALTRFGAPLTVEELARLSGWDLPLIERTLKTLCDPEVGLLEQVPRHEALRPPVIPPPAPRKPRKPKPPPFTHCPVCNADLVELAEDANAGSVGYVANAASVRELAQIRKLRVQFSNGEVPPEVVERFIQSHPDHLAVAPDSPASNETPPEPVPVTPRPAPPVRTDNRLLSRRKKHLPKPKQLNRR